MAPTSPAKKILVASHERSGTHFLLNTLALNFGFSRKWIENDIRTGVDFYLKNELRRYIECLETVSGGRAVKDHHDLAFFEPMLEQLSEKFILFYIYRNPADVMCSFWRYVRAAERREGPLVESPAAFMRAPPSRGMLRYQMEQHATILERWRAHVDAWTTLGLERAGAIPVCYEALNLDFDATVGRLAQCLGIPCPHPVRPSTTENVIVPGPGRVGGFRALLSDEDIAFIRNATLPTLRRLDILRYVSDAEEPLQRASAM